MLLLLQEILNAQLGKLCSLVRLFDVSLPHVLVLLEEFVKTNSIKGNASFVRSQTAHQETPLQALLVQLVVELKFDFVGLVFELIQVFVDLGPEVSKLVQGFLSFILELLGQS